MRVLLDPTSEQRPATRQVNQRPTSLDGLTGAYRRTPGFVELQREIDRARRTGSPLSVAFVDVDGLKTVNDTAGHAAGDRLLVEVAGTLLAVLRSYDLVIRYGGDEFVCVMEGLTLQQAGQRVGLIDAALAAGPARASVSLGCAELLPGESAPALVARADAALYLQRRMRRR